MHRPCVRPTATRKAGTLARVDVEFRAVVRREGGTLERRRAAGAALVDQQDVARAANCTQLQGERFKRRRRLSGPRASSTSGSGFGAIAYSREHGDEYSTVGEPSVLLAILGHHQRAHCTACTIFGKPAFAEQRNVPLRHPTIAAALAASASARQRSRTRAPRHIARRTKGAAMGRAFGSASSRDQDLAELADDAHRIRGRNRRDRNYLAGLHLLRQILQADDVGTRGLGRFLFLPEVNTATRTVLPVPSASRSSRAPAGRLAGIDAEVDRGVDRSGNFAWRIPSPLQRLVHGYCLPG